MIDSVNGDGVAPITWISLSDNETVAVASGDMCQQSVEGFIPVSSGLKAQKVHHAKL